MVLGELGVRRGFPEEATLELRTDAQAGERSEGVFYIEGTARQRPCGPCSGNPGSKGWIDLLKN